MKSEKEELTDKIYSDDMHGFQDDTDNAEKRMIRKPWSSEKSSSFKCAHCHSLVSVHEEMGTKHRNHCPSCLWSKHVDDKMPGDRASDCGGGMEPIGITLKIEGTDRFTGMPKYGDAMLVHECTRCGKHSINRIAADDTSHMILQILEQSESLPEQSRQQLESEGILLTRLHERSTIEVRLFGKK